MCKMEMLREAPGERALPGSGSAIDGNDHGPIHRSGRRRSAPMARIRVRNPGKLVRIIVQSSIATGSRAASPATRKDIARR